MKFNPYLGLALLGASFCLVAGKRPNWHDDETMPTAEELRCKENEIVVQGIHDNYYCELHPKHQKPLFHCENDGDCVKACEKHKYPETCRKMTTCDNIGWRQDDDKGRKICNDLAKCQIPDDTDEEDGSYPCDRIGNSEYYASLICAKREGYNENEPRCYFTGHIHT